MNDSQQDKNDSHLLQSLIFISLETILTIIVKHDRLAQAHAKPFLQQHITILFKTYLPSKNFFVTFDQHGLLFDQEKTPHIEQPQLIISASSLELLKILLTGNAKSIRKLRVTGDEHLYAPFRELLTSMSLPSVLSDWKSWFAQDSSKTKLPRRSMKQLMQRIETQQAEITELKIATKEYKYDLKALQRKYKMMSWVYCSIIFILLISIISIVCYYH